MAPSDASKFGSIFGYIVLAPISKEHPPMPYNYAWAVADPEAGLDFGQVSTSSNNPFQLTDFDWLSSFDSVLIGFLLVTISCCFRTWRQNK